MLREAEGVRYQLFEMGALEEMASVMAEAFTSDEPTTIALNIQLDEFADWIKLLGPRAALEQLTLIARDQKTNEVIGAIIADDFAFPPPEGRDVKLSNKFCSVFALLDELDARYKSSRAVHQGEYLHLAMLGVKPDRYGKKIGQRLLRFCLENGMAKGYRTAVAEVTGKISRHILTGKFGFAVWHETGYKQFVYEGRHVFESIHGPTGVFLVEKPLV